MTPGWAWLAAACVAALPLLGSVGLPARWRAPDRPGPLPGGEDEPPWSTVVSPAPRSTAGVTAAVAASGTGATALVAVLWPASLGGVGVPATAPAVVVVVAAASGGAVRLAARQRDRRAASARSDRVLEACELVAAELAAGLPAPRVLVRAADAEPLLRRAAAADGLGGDVTAALRDAASQPGAAGLARLAAAWEVSGATGQRLAPAVRSAAAGLRREQATRRVVTSELASARATARLLAVLPLLALLVGGGTGGAPWAFLLGTPAGVGCLAGGLALGWAGLAWVERIADGADILR